MTIISYTLFFKYFLIGGEKCPKCGKKELFFGIIEKEWFGIRCMFCGYEERIEKREKLPTGLLRLFRLLRLLPKYGKVKT
jgi:Zn ribbon nucleic-acid-binding protein